MNVNRDYDQLRAYLALLVELECQIDEINEAKGRAFREAKACGFPRDVVRDLLRMKQDGKLDDLDVPSAFEGILSARGIAQKTD